MASHLHNSTDELRRIVAEGKISEQALHAITGIPIDTIRAVLATASLAPGMMVANEPALSADENTRLSMLTAQLTAGLQIDDDERLKGMLESLTIECRLTLDNIAGLTGTDVDDLELALRDPREVAADTKYRLATRTSYLINAINQARR